MFFFRLNKLRLVDNHSGKGFLGLGHDHASVQLWSIVINGNIDLPNLEELLQTPDNKKSLKSLQDM